jgi:thymidylate kinase
MNGKLIVFEGPDGSGKSGMAQRAKEWMEKYLLDKNPEWPAGPGRQPYVHLIKYPGNPKIELCRDIRQMIFNKPYSKQLDAVEQGLLFFIDYYASADYAAALVEQGDIVISDRWCYSQFAYDPVKTNPQVHSCNLFREFETKKIQPSLVIQMDADPETIMMRLAFRMGKDVSQEQKRALWGDKDATQVHTELRQSYRNLAKRYQHAHSLGGPVEWVVVTQAPDQSQDDVFADVEAILVDQFGRE